MMNTDDALQNLKKYSFNPADLLKLDNFLAPTLILIFYWITMVLTILGCIIQIGSAFYMMRLDFISGLGWLVLGLISLVLSPLLVRLVFEWMIVLFNIHDHLRRLRDHADKTGG